MARRAENVNAAARQLHPQIQPKAILRARRRELFQAFMLSAACLGGIGLVGSRPASAQLSENWESVVTGGTFYPSTAPDSGTPYSITTSGANGLGTWTAITSDPTNAYYAVGANSQYGAGGSGNVVGEAGASHDSSAGSMLLQSPVFYLSDAATGGSISMTYIGGAYGSDVPGNISGLGKSPGNAGFGFMGVALVDSSGNIVESSSNLTTGGSAGGAAYTLNYAGLSPTMPYTLDLIDDGTRGSNWGWNGIDNISIPSGSLTLSVISSFNWTAATGEFSTGSNWDAGTAPSNLTEDQATISNGGTATIGSTDTITLNDLFVGSSSGTNNGNVIQTGGSITVNTALAVGYNTGTGSYTLSGSGSSVSAASLIVGSAGTGMFTQTDGTVSVFSNMTIGSLNGTGTYNMSGGTVLYSGAKTLVVTGYGSTPSVLNLSGSAVLNSSNAAISIGDAPADGSTATGILNMADTSSLNATETAQLWIGNNPGETGIANISGGTITSNSWISIGRTGATGIVNLSGTGSIVKAAGSVGDVSIGGGTGGLGILNQTGGTYTDSTSLDEIGETTGSTGIWNMSGGVANINIAIVGYSGTGIVNLSGDAQITANQFLVGYNTGTTGTFNLNGGTLSTAIFQQDSGTAYVYLNGGIIQATADTTTLLNRFSPGAVNALAGGAIFDSNGHTATLTSSITSPAGVTGGFTKIGVGTIILAASNTYTGNTTVSAGTLRLTGPGTSVPVANFSFEANSAGGSGYTYYNGDPATDGYWNYISDGGATMGAGITSGNGFAFGGSPPDGTQAGFIQKTGAIEQTIDFPQTASYTLGFYSEQRNGGNASTETLDVLLDGTDISSGGLTPGSNWAQTTYIFPATQGSHTIDFQGTNINGGDNTAFIDDVTLAGNYGAGPGNYIPTTSPVVIADNATFDVNGNTQEIGSLTGTPLSSVTLGSGTLITGGDGTSTTFAGAISGTGGVTKLGAGVQQLSGSNTYTGGTLISGGSLVFASPGALPVFTALSVNPGAIAVAASHTGTAKNTLFVSGLSLAGSTGAWTGQVDLTNNDMVVRNGSISTITNQVAQGYAGGTWQGSGGITSSAAAADGSHLTALGVIQNSVDGSATGAALYGTFDGQTVLDTDVLVKYTYYGDTNLDGQIDGTDYSRIDNGALNNLTGWFNGDFNYDGVIDGSDYTLIDNAYNTQGAAIAAEIGGSAATVTAQLAGSGTSSAVPEPASLGLLVMGGVGLLRRRRRSL